MYLVKSPWILKKLYPFCVWDLPASDQTLYLTFDDGPHPVATPFILDVLKASNAKATFFCIGKNVAAYPDLYNRILMEGHRVGNHTYNHLNGWKFSDQDYVSDIIKAKKLIDSNLFRPPYGRITNFQAKLLRRTFSSREELFKIIMWNVLSGDFDFSITGEQCAKKVINNVKNGSIIVFHDSEKAFPRLEIALPIVLEHFRKKGYKFETIRM